MGLPGRSEVGDLERPMEDLGGPALVRCGEAVLLLPESDEAARPPMVRLGVNFTRWSWIFRVSFIPSIIAAAHLVGMFIKSLWSTFAPPSVVGAHRRVVVRHPVSGQTPTFGLVEPVNVSSTG